MRASGPASVTRIAWVALCTAPTAKPARSRTVTATGLTGRDAAGSSTGGLIRSRSGTGSRAASARPSRATASTAGGAGLYRGATTRGSRSIRVVPETGIVCW